MRTLESIYYPARGARATAWRRAAFAAIANVVMTVKSVGRDERHHTRRLGRHFHEEEFADEHEPLDDYDEALVEVSNQDDPGAARRVASARPRRIIFLAESGNASDQDLVTDRETSRELRGDAADETSAAHNDERMTTKTTAISTGATDANPPAEGTHLLETTHRPTIRCESRHFSHDIIIIIMYTRVLSNWRKVCRDKFFQRN